MEIRHQAGAGVVAFLLVKRNTQSDAVFDPVPPASAACSARTYHGLAPTVGEWQGFDREDRARPVRFLACWRIGDNGVRYRIRWGLSPQAVFVERRRARSSRATPARRTAATRDDGPRSGFVDPTDARNGVTSESASDCRNWPSPCAAASCPVSSGSPDGPTEPVADAR
jgi:hypothetical protein